MSDVADVDTPDEEGVTAEDDGLNLDLDLSGLTLDQLHDRLAAIDTEIEELGSRTEMTAERSRRRNQLIAHEVQVTEMVTELQNSINLERPDRPERVAVKEAPPTNVADEVQQLAEPVAELVNAATEDGVAAATQTFQNPGGMLGEGAAEITTRVEFTPTAEELDHLTPGQVMEAGSIVQRAKREGPSGKRPDGMFASIGTGSVADGNLEPGGDELDYQDVADRLSAAVLRAGGVEEKRSLYRRERFRDLDVRQYTTDLDMNERARVHNLQYKDEMAAAICGPVDVDREVRICGGGTNGRPITQKIVDANGAEVIGNGQVAYLKGLSLCDVTIPDPFLDCDDVAAIDVNDQSTWKQCSTLPACDDDATVRAQVNFLYRCLETDVCDEMSRPEYIAAFESLLEARLDQAGEQAILRTIDSYSYTVDDANPTGYGSLPQVIYRVQEMLGVVEGTCRFETEGYCLTVNTAHVRNLLNDGYFAGASLTEVVAELQAGLNAIGVDLTVTADWGAEGNPVTPLTLPQPHPAYGTNAAITQTYDATTPATSFTARLWRPSDFRFGSAGIEEYGIVTDSRTKLTNRVLRFGETVELAWKPGVCPSFLINFTNSCANGARPGPVCPHFCGLV